MLQELSEAFMGSRFFSLLAGALLALARNLLVGLPSHSTIHY